MRPGISRDVVHGILSQWTAREVDDGSIGPHHGGANLLRVTVSTEVRQRYLSERRGAPSLCNGIVDFGRVRSPRIHGQDLPARQDGPAFLVVAVQLSTRVQRAKRQSRGIEGSHVR